MNKEKNFKRTELVPGLADAASAKESQGGCAEYLWSYSAIEAFDEFEDRMSGIDEEATRERVCALLKERGLTDRVLSEKIGISRQAVNKWRHKKNFVDIENLYILSGILKMKIDDLLVPRKRSQERAVLIETNGNIGDLSNLRLKMLKRYYVLIMEMMARKMPRDASQAS